MGSVFRGRALPPPRGRARPALAPARRFGSDSGNRSDLRRGCNPARKDDRRAVRIHAIARRSKPGPGPARQRLGAGHPPRGNDVAVVEQGDRHRPQLRPRAGAARGTRHPLGGFRGRWNRRAGARSVVRPHDRTPLRAPRVRGAWRTAPRLAPGSRGPRGPLPRCTGRTARADISGARAGTRPARRGPAARARAQRGGSPLAVRPIRCTRPRPDRRGAHDVRPGELRALPAQDLQRILDGGRPAERAVPLRHDPAHPCGEPRPGALRLP